MGGVKVGVGFRNTKMCPVGSGVCTHEGHRRTC
jgi:uncharacterized membrane protein YedE/YeeE